MKLLTTSIREKLIRNGRIIDPHDEDIAFGLCDLGMGFPELGRVRISELKSVRGKLGLPIERDLHFHTSKTLSVHAEEARLAGSIMV